MNNYVGRQLGNYRVTRQIGQGGFADVYLAEHIYLKTLAAIKVLQARLAGDELELFLNEARIISGLIHPHIVRVLEFGVEQNTTPFLVMDYAPNGTLRQRPPGNTRLTLPQIVPYVQQVASALQYAHDRKLIHRDIKPENMLLNQNNQVLLSDFGIALTSQSSRYQQTQDVVGTIGYMSPEQFMGKPVPASDQYALATVVYEWISGNRPFHGSFAEVASQHMMATPAPLATVILNLPPSVDSVLQQALKKDPQQRFMRIEAFANALAQASGVPLQYSATPPPPGIYPSIQPSSPNNMPNPFPQNVSANFTGTTFRQPPVTNQSNSSTFIMNNGVGQQPPYQPGNMVSPRVPQPQKDIHISRRTLMISIASLVGVGVVGGSIAIAAASRQQNSGSPNTGLATGGGTSPANSGSTPTSVPTDTPTSIATDTPSATDTPNTTPTDTGTPGDTPTVSGTAAPAGTLLYSADWSSGLNGWGGPASWKVSNSLLLNDGTVGNGSYSDTQIVPPYQAGGTSDYAIEAQIRVIRSNNGTSFGILTRGGYYVGIRDTSTAYIDTNNNQNYLNSQAYGLDTAWHTYRVEVKSNLITFLLDKQPIVKVLDNQYLTGGQVGIYDFETQIEVSSFKVTAL